MNAEQISYANRATRPATMYQPEEKAAKEQGSPTQNSEITVNHRSEGFHILELRAPTLGSCLGLVLMVVIVIGMLLVYHKYRKRLSEVKYSERPPNKHSGS